ncbi:MAG: TolC family protein [Desulfobulbaceae bacterium]|nr:TolC family protein [Desulfobulbaceae bacterium]
MPGVMRVVAAWAVCLLVWCSAPAAADDAGMALSLEHAVSLALRNNPDLSAVKARALAMAEMPEQQGSLADPQLTLRAANFPMDTFAIDQEAMTQLQVSLTQALPFPGKLALRRQIAELESSAADFALAEERLLLIQDVKSVWWNIYYLDRALETVERNQELYRQLNSIAQTKYEVGSGLQQEVLLARLELSRLLDARISLENMRRNEIIRLNTLLNRQADTGVVLPRIDKVDFPEIPALDQLFDRALRASPKIQDMSSKAAAAERRVSLAEMKYSPDFMAGATYGYREGENPNGSDRADFATVGLTMNLPFFNRAEKERAVSQSRHEAFQQTDKLKSAENAIMARVATAFSDYRKNQEEMELLDGGIIPQARQTLDSMLAGYQVNKVDFLNLLQAQTSLYNYETRYWKAFSSANQALARLAAAIGEEAIDQ